MCLFSSCLLVQCDGFEYIYVIFVRFFEVNNSLLSTYISNTRCTSALDPNGSECWRYILLRVFSVNNIRYLSPQLFGCLLTPCFLRTHRPCLAFVDFKVCIHFYYFISEFSEAQYRFIHVEQFQHKLQAFWREKEVGITWNPLRERTFCVLVTNRFYGVVMPHARWPIYSLIFVFHETVPHRLVSTSGKVFFLNCSSPLFVWYALVCFWTNEWIHLTLTTFLAHNPHNLIRFLWLPTQKKSIQYSSNNDDWYKCVWFLRIISGFMNVQAREKTSD